MRGQRDHQRRRRTGKNALQTAQECKTGSAGPACCDTFIALSLTWMGHLPLAWSVQQQMPTNGCAQAIRLPTNGPSHQAAHPLEAELSTAPNHLILHARYQARLLVRGCGDGGAGCGGSSTAAAAAAAAGGCSTIHGYSSSYRIMEGNKRSASSDQWLWQQRAAIAMQQLQRKQCRSCYSSKGDRTCRHPPLPKG